MLHGHTRCINQRLRPQPHMRQRQGTEPALHSAQHTSQAAAAIVQNGINAVTLHVYMQHTDFRRRYICCRLQMGRQLAVYVCHIRRTRCLTGIKFSVGMCVAASVAASNCVAEQAETLHKNTATLSGQK